MVDTNYIGIGDVDIDDRIKFTDATCVIYGDENGYTIENYNGEDLAEISYDQLQRIINGADPERIIINIQQGYDIANALKDATKIMVTEIKDVLEVRGYMPKGSQSVWFFSEGLDSYFAFRKGILSRFDVKRDDYLPIKAEWVRKPMTGALPLSA